MVPSIINLVTDNVPMNPNDNLPSMSIYDNPFVLEGSHTTSGLDLVYTTSNSSVLQVTNDGKLDPKVWVMLIMTISQPGDSHFSAAPAVRPCNEDHQRMASIGSF